MSASQIATELTGVTRNAVIGKVHRLGLSGRSKGNAPAAQQRPRKPARQPGSPAERSDPPERSGPLAHASPQLPDPEPPVEAEEVAVPMSERVTIMELREFMCRWPLGDPTNAEFRFCGARAITGLPYCTGHARVAYQPAADRRRGDRRLAIRA